MPDLRNREFRWDRHHLVDVIRREVTADELTRRYGFSYEGGVSASPHPILRLPKIGIFKEPTSAGVNVGWRFENNSRQFLIRSHQFCSGLLPRPDRRFK
jgi:hypothetical protein